MGYSLGIYKNGDIEKPCVLQHPKGDLFLRGSNIPVTFDANGNPHQIANELAEIDITYNYSRYFYEATNGDKRFLHQDSNGNDEYGIRGLYGKKAIDTIPMLADMIRRIVEKYTKNGKWKNGKRKKIRYFDKDGNEVEDFLSYIFRGQGDELTKKEETYTVSEGDTDNYWEVTAANAVKAISTLMDMAVAAPDGIWMGD